MEGAFLFDHRLRDVLFRAQKFEHSNADHGQPVLKLAYCLVTFRICGFKLRSTYPPRQTLRRLVDDRSLYPSLAARARRSRW